MDEDIIKGDEGTRNGNEGSLEEPGATEPNRPPDPARPPRPGAEARWRRRALEAEERLRAMEEKVQELERLLAQAREALDASERRRIIEREVAREGAIDVETAALLTELAVAGMREADVAGAVAELKRRKPFLFRRAPASPASAMIPGEAGPGAELEDAARTARDTGNRQALLRYLRLRRGERA